VEKLARYNDYVERARLGEWDADQFLAEFFPSLNSADRAWILKNRLTLSQVRAGLPPVDPLINPDEIRVLHPQTKEVITRFAIVGSPGRLALRVNDRVSLPITRSTSMQDFDRLIQEAIQTKPDTVSLLWEMVVPSARAFVPVVAGVAALAGLVGLVLAAMNKGASAEGSGSASAGGDNPHQANGGGGEGTVPNGFSGGSGGGMNDAMVAASVSGSSSDLCKKAAANLSPMRPKAGNACLAAVKKHVCDTWPNLCMIPNKSASSPNRELGSAFEPRWKGAAEAKDSGPEFEELGFKPSPGMSPQEAPEGAIVIWQSCSGFPEGHVAVACGQGARKVFIADTAGSALACSDPTVYLPPVVAGTSSRKTASTN